MHEAESHDNGPFYVCFFFSQMLSVRREILWYVRRSKEQIFNTTYLIAQ